MIKILFFENVNYFDYIQKYDEFWIKGKNTSKYLKNIFKVL